MPEPTDLTAAKYREMRERLDTRRACARALGVSEDTMRLRESGLRSIGREAGLAIRFLARHGLPRYLRARRNRRVDPADVTWGTPGELREALAILGMTPAEGARSFFGPGESARVRMSRMVTGAQRITESAALMVKRRLGLRLDDPWPVREGIAWDNTNAVIASLKGGR